MSWEAVVWIYKGSKERDISDSKVGLNIPMHMRVQENQNLKMNPELTRNKEMD